MSNTTVTIQLSDRDAKRLVDSLESTLMIAGECVLGDERQGDGTIVWGSLENDPDSESGAIENVAAFTGQLRDKVEKAPA